MDWEQHSANERNWPAFRHSLFWGWRPMPSMTIVPPGKTLQAPRRTARPTGTKSGPKHGCDISIPAFSQRPIHRNGRIPGEPSTTRSPGPVSRRRQWIGSAILYRGISGARVDPPCLTHLKCLPSVWTGFETPTLNEVLYTPNATSTPTNNFYSGLVPPAASKLKSV